MTVYNKIFTKILDSSIWLEPTTTRLVWLTFIAAMDEDGFAQFASVKNLAHRARVSVEEAETAVKCLESADPDSSDPDNEGRRLERVPGGWMVLNAPKYREMVTRVVIKEQTRRRVAKHRAAKCNGDVTPSNENVTPSDTATHSKSKEEGESASGLPSLKSCLSQISNAGIDADFATYVYADWASRDGKDAGGVKTRWPAYISKRWAREKDEWKSGCHKGQKTNGTAPIRCKV